MDYKEKYDTLLKEHEELKAVKKEPKKKESSPAQVGRDLYKRLKESGKIRGGRI